MNQSTEPVEKPNLKIVPPSPSIEEVEAESKILVVEAKELKIVSESDRDFALDKLAKIRGLLKDVEKIFKDPKEKAWNAHKSIVAAEKKLLDPLRAAELSCANTVKIYLEDVRRREREAEAERARKEAEERRRLEEENARLRREAEERAREDAERERKRIEENTLASAVALEEVGLSEEAYEVLSVEPIVAPAPVYVQPVPVKTTSSYYVSAAPIPTKIKGVNLRANWKAVVTDFLCLIREVAAGRQPADLLVPNQKRLDEMAKALRDHAKIPGVQFREESSLVDRRGSNV